MKKRIILISLIAIILSSPVYSEVVNRKIAAFYDSRFEKSPFFTRIHTNLEVVLNHYGFIVDYFDINKDLPPEKKIKEYYAVITWFFTADLPEAESYCKWLGKVIDDKIKVVILGSFGFFSDSKTGKQVDDEIINSALKKLGLQHKFMWNENAYEVSVEYKVPEMVEFERNLEYEVDYFEQVVSINPRNKVYLKLKVKNYFGDDYISDVVVTTPDGGFVEGKYVFYQDPVNEKRQWRLNPFLFFRKALGLDVIVTPDVNVLNGRRIFYSHIDGDGFNNFVQYGDNRKSSLELRDQILKKYNIPVTVSVITGEIIPEYGNKKENIDIAKSIFKLKNIEAASHSFTHPLVWDDVDNERTEVTKITETQYGEANDEYIKHHTYILDNVKKRKPGYRLNSVSEIKESIDYINEMLVPKNKKTKTFFWTGNCLPGPKALALIYKYGLININGGDSRFDEIYPSYMYLYPLGLKVGKYRQFYSSNQNENTYTNLWTGPFYGFQNVIHTFENTGSPIMIKPVDVYYHFYSAEHLASISALKKIYNWVLTQKINPIFIREFVNILKGYYNTEIIRISNNHYRVKKNGKCRTVRFDNTDKHPDIKQSENIIGYNHINKSLYVFLDEKDKHDIILTDKKEEDEPYIKETSAEITEWSIKGKIKFRADIKGIGFFKIYEPSEVKKYTAEIQYKDNSKENIEILKKDNYIIFEKDLFDIVDIEIREK